MVEADRSMELSAAEDKAVRAQLQGHFVAMVPVCFICLALALAGLPAGSMFEHLQQPGAYLSPLAVACTALTAAAARSAPADIVRRFRVVSYASLAVRLVVHVVTIVFDQDSHVFFKLVGVMLPVDASTVCHSPAAFKAYLVMHNLLVFARVGGDLERGGAWIVGSLLMSVFSHDRVKQEATHGELRMQLAAAYLEVERTAETATRDIFGRLCDACVSLATDGRIRESSPQLPSMLGMLSRSVQGRPFVSLLHQEEPPESASFAEAAAEPGKVHHRQVQLADIYGQPVRVHVFSTFFARLDGTSNTVLGISETWSPPKAKDSSDGTLGRGDGSSHAVSRREQRGGDDATASGRSSAAGVAAPSAAAAGARGHARGRRDARESGGAGFARFWEAVASNHTRTRSRARSEPHQPGGEAAAPERLWAGPRAGPSSRPTASRPGTSPSPQILARRPSRRRDQHAALQNT